MHQNHHQKVAEMYVHSRLCRTLTKIPLNNIQNRLISTSDLSDKYGDQIDVVEPLFRCYGGKKSFYGPIQTVKCVEDNSLVKKQLESLGENRVLVVDGGGSLRRSLLGDNYATIAMKNQWVGIIVFGAIRDSEAINAMDFGVRALATTPRKTDKKDRGLPFFPKVNVAVKFGGVQFTPGQWVYVDADGIVVSDNELVLP